MRWNYRTELATVLLLVLLGACSSVPRTPEPQAEEARGQTADGAQRSPDVTPSGEQAPGKELPGATAPLEVPAPAAAEFAAAVAQLRAGELAGAQRAFEQLAASYPQLSGPHANLGILHRKAGRLDDALQSLQTAVERNPASAPAWNELGVVLRLRGEFTQAATAYERSIAADPAFAPAHRNLGVLRDLYLGDPESALTAFEQYKALTSEEKPVSSWIAELRQRTSRPAEAPDAPAPSTAQTPSPVQEGGIP